MPFRRKRRGLAPDAGGLTQRIQRELNAVDAGGLELVNQVLRIAGCSDQLHTASLSAEGLLSGFP